MTGCGLWLCAAIHGSAQSRSVLAPVKPGFDGCSGACPMSGGSDQASGDWCVHATSIPWASSALYTV
jgi:hypothetical protein